MSIPPVSIPSMNTPPAGNQPANNQPEGNRPANNQRADSQPAGKQRADGLEGCRKALAAGMVVLALGAGAILIDSAFRPKDMALAEAAAALGITEPALAPAGHPLRHPLLSHPGVPVDLASGPPTRF